MFVMTIWDSTAKFNISGYTVIDPGSLAQLTQTTCTLLARVHNTLASSYVGLVLDTAVTKIQISTQ